MKKLRWKWHHDMTVQMDESAGLLEEINKKLSYNPSDPKSIKPEEYIEEVQKQVKYIESQLEMCSSQLAQIKNADLDCFSQYVEMEKVFNLMGDRESQKLFWALMHYKQDRNLVPLYQFIMRSERPGNPKDIIWLLKTRANKTNLKDELIIYGTAFHAKEMLLVMQGLGCKVDYICKEDDTSSFTNSVVHSQTDYDWLGIPVITEEELLNSHKNAKVVVAVLQNITAKKRLSEKGFPAGNLFLRFSEIGKQYLDPDIMRPRQHEVFIDGGVLDLKNSLDFINWCGGNYDAVYAFEPDEHSYKKCLDIIQNDQQLDENKVHLFNAALWNRDEELHFNSGDEGGSKVSSHGTSAVQARSIDSVLQGERVTFIKMDIEGAEMNALIGARESIKKWKPRLAICIYHKPNDPIELPLYIHGLVPEYKMYIRHYSTCRWETVLYCVCPESSDE